MTQKPAPTEIVEYLRSKHDSLSDSQQAVIEFLLTHGLEAIYMSSSQIAEQVNVNRSTVIRTAQALGFDGFSELQTALQKHFQRQYGGRVDIGSDDLLTEIGTAADGETLLRRMVSIETEKLKTLPEIIRPQDFDYAVQLLSDAQRIGIIGMYLSKSLAMNLYYPLTFMRKGCILIEPDAAAFARDLISLKRNDVLFAISNTRYARVTLQCMEYAREVGAMVIALTDNPLSPAAKRADLTFVIPPKLWFYGNSVVPSTFLNTLSAALLLRHPHAQPDELNTASRMFDRFGTFVDGDE